MKTALKTFEPNVKGRDFVIGDLHGNFPAFLNLLKHLNFDPEVDRMFSCSDLVDRGEDSMNCLRLIRESWFHAVLANHEQMMIEAFKGGKIGNYWFQNGGRWGLEAWVVHGKILEAKCNKTSPPIAHEEQLELYDLVEMAAEELPYLITVKMPAGHQFHILHAELPPGKLKLTDADLDESAKVFKLATIKAGDGDAFLWSRNVYQSFYNYDLTNHDKIVRKVAHQFNGTSGPYNDKLSHIISGHTIVRAPLTIFGQTNIDTCAYAAQEPDRWEQLTCINLHDWKFFQATATSFKSVEPVVVNKSDVDAVRGN